MHTQIYLFLDGRCDEALEFYKKNLGIEVEMLMRFCEGKSTFQGFALAPVKDEVEADRVFNALSEGGQVQIPQDVLLA